MYLVNSLPPAALAKRRGVRQGMMTTERKRSYLEEFLQDQQLGEKLNCKIADIVNKDMLTIVHHDKVKEVVANHPPPANTPNLVTPKMDGKLWEMLPSLNFQKTIRMVTTMLTISVRMMDLLCNKTSNPTSSEVSGGRPTTTRGSCLR
ncbi:hypothetical protein ElyMa_000053600 [Elysia marginata]|uniref:Uncharacterized protein n=1 Tax=Elysia marginata TaxID=1093978 RepID=A0AAV4EEY4_9GAST|nr:hypothetical protein ElyMa_000053600 [Elysia marginata]